MSENPEAALQISSFRPTKSGLFSPPVYFVLALNTFTKKCFRQLASKYHHKCKSEKYMKAAYLLDNETSLDHSSV